MSSSAAESDLVRAALARWLHAFNQRDVDAMALAYDPETVYAGAGSPRLEGATAVCDNHRRSADADPLKVKFIEETLVVGSELALLAGKFQFNDIADDGTLTPTGTGRAHLVFRRRNDGAWLMLYDTDNHPPDVTNDDFAEA